MTFSSFQGKNAGDRNLCRRRLTQDPKRIEVKIKEEKGRRTFHTQV